MVQRQDERIKKLWLLRCDWIFKTPMDHSIRGLPVHRQLPVYSNSCPLSGWCHPTIASSVVPFSFCLQSFPASDFFFVLFCFSNESALRIRWTECWSFSFSMSASNEYSELISFRMDWSDILAVKGTLKSLFQHYSSKASILWFSAFFIVQLSHPYMTTGKTIALTRWTLVAK